jgi:hypothetical protein
MTLRTVHPELRGRLDCSAASGLVVDATRLWVVADDESDLFVYDRASLEPLGRIPLFAGRLPDDPKARKAVKADLEMLTRLPDGRLLALGSGSTDRRARGVVVDGARVQPLDLTPLYAHLATRLPDLNLEGAAVVGHTLCLLQRGNGASGHNALVRLDLAGLLTALEAGRPLGPELMRSLVPVALGALDGVALGFTDACAHPRDPDTLVFTCAAEGGGSTYEDGHYAGSAVGVLDLNGHLHGPLVRLAGVDKIEGIHAELSDDGRLALLLVADADDRGVRAPLYSVTV